MTQSAYEQAVEIANEGLAPMPLFLSPARLKPLIDENKTISALLDKIEYVDDGSVVAGYDAAIRLESGLHQTKCRNHRCLRRTNRASLGSGTRTLGKRAVIPQIQQSVFQRHKRIHRQGVGLLCLLPHQLFQTFDILLFQLQISFFHLNPPSAQAKSRASRPGEGLSDSPRRWSAFRFGRSAQSESDAACAPNEKRLPAAHLAAPPNLMQRHAALSSCLNPK